MKFLHLYNFFESWNLPFLCMNSCLICVITWSFCTFTPVYIFQFLALQVWYTIVPYRAATISFCALLQCLLLISSITWSILVACICMWVHCMIASFTFCVRTHWANKGSVDSNSCVPQRQHSPFSTLMCIFLNHQFIH